LILNDGVYVGMRNIGKSHDIYYRRYSFNRRLNWVIRSKSQG
jgi:hypothetical protein